MTATAAAPTIAIRPAADANADAIIRLALKLAESIVEAVEADEDLDTLKHRWYGLAEAIKTLAE